MWGSIVLHKFAILIGCMIFTANAVAVPTDKKEEGISGASSGVVSSSDAIKASNNQVVVQSISTFVDYTETGNGQLGTAMGTLDTETGPVLGQAYYISAMKDVLLGNDYARVMFDHSSGLTNYVGGALPNGTYGSVVGTSSAVLSNFSVRYGRGFDIGGTRMLTPYVELSTHTWERGINYGETYTHSYYGVGLLGQYLMHNKTVLSVDALLGHTKGSYIAVNSGSGLIGFAGALGDSMLYKVGISLDYLIAPRLHGNVGADYTAFIYGISAVYPSGTTSAWEPDSRTNYATIRVGLGWGF